MDQTDGQVRLLAEDGTLVASVAQEGLIRMKPAK